MVNHHGNSPLDPAMNLGSEYYLHPYDSGQKLINIVFSGFGFVDWKKVMVIALSENK